MIGISLCMIIKNEEEVIGRCLDSIKDIVDEIIIVDTGSTDSSKEIVKKYTDKVYDFEWVDDFSKARNYSFSKATKDYIMWLDADDVILKKDRKKLKELKRTLNPSVDMVMMKYNIAFDDNGNPTFSYVRERLLKRSNNYKWVGPIHEVIIPEGNIICSDIAVSHKKLRESEPGRNLRIFRKMIDEGMPLDTRQKFYYARELYSNKKYEEAIKQYNVFLESKDGWIENCISACTDLYNSYKLLNNEEKAIESLIRSLEYDEPRAEVCCELGAYFLKMNKIKAAIFWYKTASEREINENIGGFKLIDCYRFIPYMQLCFCYDKLGDHKTAKYYNEKAAEIKPDDEAVKYNKAYFKKINM